MEIGPKDMNQAPNEEIKRNQIILKQILYEEQSMDTLSHSHSTPKDINGKQNVVQQTYLRMPISSIISSWFSL